MRRGTIRIALALSLGIASVARADSMRCEGGLVAVGDSRLDLEAKCGAPALRELEPIPPAHDVDLSLVVERWTYDFGPLRFMEIVTLQGGQIVAIERGGYGHDRSQQPPARAVVPRARCEHDAFRVGDRTLDVLSRCGEPLSRDLRRGTGVGYVDVWTYDFGERELVRFLEFEGGKLVRIRTGSYGYSR